MPEEYVRHVYRCNEFFGYLLQMLPPLFLLYIPYRQEHLKIRKQRLLLLQFISTVAVSVGAAWVLGCLYETLDKNSLMMLGNLIFSVFLLLETGIYFSIIRKSAGFRLLTYMLVLQYAVFLYSAAEVGTKFLHVPWHNYGFTPYSETAVMIYLVGTLITFPLAYRFLRYFGRIRVQRVGKKSMRLISASSVAIFLLYVCSLQGEMMLSQLHQDMTTNILLSSGMICLVILDILIYYIYFRCLSIEEEKEKVSLRLASEEMQYQSLQDKIREDKRMYHNMRHHFRTLGAFLEEGRYQDMEAYLRKYLQEWDKSSAGNICSNPMLNSILSYYVSVAEAKGIRLRTDIDVKEYYPFAVTDMTVLLGNAMENAVEGCTKEGVKDPLINLMIKQYKSALLIQIENRCSDAGYPVLGEGKTPSTKKGRNHGYGLSSMDMIARKYQGTMDYRKKNGIFTLRIVLNIPNGPTAGREKSGTEQ